MAGDDPIRPEIVRWTGPREALRPDAVTAAPILDDSELLDRLLVIVRDAETRLEEIATAETTEVFRWLRAEVGALLVARASYQPDPASIRMDDVLLDGGWRPPPPPTTYAPPTDRIRAAVDDLIERETDRIFRDALRRRPLRHPWEHGS